MLWSVLLMLGLAIVLGVLIVLFSILFHVEEDPRIAAVEKMLPNYNCGACGKAGCHDMAEALVSGEVKNVSKCKVGKKDKNYDPIVAYLASTPGPDGKTLEVSI
ncbi:MAG: electron transporter RnfB [Bacilli bacterium]|nr:electron transporter RnfB [Bacilli bacterium]